MLRTRQRITRGFLHVRLLCQPPALACAVRERQACGNAMHARHDADTDAVHLRLVSGASEPSLQQIETRACSERCAMQ